MKRMWSGLILLLMILPADRVSGGQEDFWTREWENTRTASVRVHYAVGEAPDRAQLRDLERAVRRLSGELSLSDRQFASLRVDPIEYLFLPDDTSMSWFGIADVDGMALVADRRIVAARLPHEHELVHVLAQIAISPAPAQNHPFIQEGLASYLGGHLDESPLAVLARGDDVLRRNPGLISRILTVDGFRESPLPDEECYAASARFLHYLDSERGGRARILSLMRLLAGSEADVLARPGSFAEVQMEGVYDTAFADLLGAFEAWRTVHPVAGIVDAEPPQRRAELVLVDSDHRVRWWSDAAGWVLEVTPYQREVDLALVWGSVSLEAGTWTEPGKHSGYEMRITEEGGRLIDHGRPGVVLRWFAEPRAGDDVSPRAWFIPAGSLGPIQSPDSPDAVTLWSQPRFLVD